MLTFLDTLKNDLLQYRSTSKTDSIFVNISGYYYHENYHSDILAHYLSFELPKKYFINWMNANRHEGKDEIHYRNYSQGDILREAGRIDITLMSNDGKSAIIIENKSNNAVDQDKQLFRYCNALKKNGIELESILYLNKNSNKPPDFTGLNEGQIREVKDVLTIGQLVGPQSFEQNVINLVILDSSDIRLNAFSREIKGLLNYVVFGEVNMEFLQDFETMLATGENFAEFKNAIKAYNDMPNYLARKYLNILTDKKYPSRVWQYKPQCLVVGDIDIRGHRFALDIWFFQDQIDISILDRHEDYSLVESLKTEMGDKFPFYEKLNDRYRLVIDNPYDSKSVEETIDRVVRAFM